MRALNRGRVTRAGAAIPTLAGALVVLLAAVPRLAAPGISEFKLDEAALSLLALRLADGQAFPLLGIGSSLGAPNTPVAVWFYALPYLAGPNPALAVIWTALLNVVGAALLWALARRLGGTRLALVAGLFYAASPWAILFSRKIWAQNLLLPLVLAAGYALLRAFEDDDWRWQVAGWLLLALAAQVHYAGAAFLPVAILLTLLAARRPARALLTGAGIGALSLVPFALGLHQSGLSPLELARSLVNGADGASLRLSLDAARYLWMLAAGGQIHSLAGPEQFAAYLRSVLVGYGPFQALPLLGLAGLAVLPWSAAPRRALLLAAWLCVPVLAFTPTWTPVTPHYLLPALPAAWLLAGRALLLLAAPRWPRPRLRAALAALLLVALIGLQLQMVGGLLRFLNHTATPGGFGVPLNRLIAVRDAALAAEAGMIVLGIEGDTPGVDEDAAVWSALLYGTPGVHLVDARRAAVILPERAIEVIHRTPPVMEGLAAGYWASPSQGTPYAARPGEPDFFIREPQGNILEGMSDPLDAPPFAGGTVLQRLGLGADETLLVFALGAAPQTTPHVTAQYCDSAGERVGQMDGPTWPAQYWRPGVRLALWLPIGAPPGADNLLVGLYEWAADGQIVGIPALDTAGNPAGAGVEVRLHEGSGQ